MNSECPLFVIDQKLVAGYLGVLTVCFAVCGVFKVCDVISKWEQALSEHLSADSPEDSSRTIRLVYKNR